MWLRTSRHGLLHPDQDSSLSDDLLFNTPFFSCLFKLSLCLINRCAFFIFKMLSKNILFFSFTSFCHIFVFFPPVTVNFIHWNREAIIQTTFCTCYRDKYHLRSYWFCIANFSTKELLCNNNSNIVKIKYLRNAVSCDGKFYLTASLFRIKNKHSKIKWSVKSNMIDHSLCSYQTDETSSKAGLGVEHGSLMQRFKV